MAWDEPDLLQNVKYVSPWLVELVSNMPVIHLWPFSPPRKKLRLPPDFSLDSQFQLPSFSGNPLRSSSTFCCLSDNITAGIQGARHAQFGVPLLDLGLSNKLPSGLLPQSLQGVAGNSQSPNIVNKCQNDTKDNVSCLLTMGTSSKTLEKNDSGNTPRFLLFGQPILTEQQISNGCSINAPEVVRTGTDIGRIQLKNERFPPDQKGSIQDGLSSSTHFWNQSYHAAELGVLDTGHCKVFLESEDVGRTLDLSLMGSYEELYRRLANMFGLERSDMLTRVLYHDAAGFVKHTGDEPFRCLTFLHYPPLLMMFLVKEGSIYVHA